MPTTSCKQTWLIDDVMQTDINFVACKIFGYCLFMELKMQNYSMVFT